MPKFIFIGDPAHGGEGPDSVSMFGLSFYRDEPTEVSDPAIVGKLSYNSHFAEVTDGEVTEITMPVDAEPSPTSDEVDVQVITKPKKTRKTRKPRNG